MIELLQSLLKKHKAVSIVAASISIVLGIIWNYGHEVVPQDKTSTIHLLLWLKISLSILLLFLTSISLNIYLIKRLSIPIDQTEPKSINIDDYIQPEELGGVSQHKETGELRCTSCLVNKILSPVKKYKYEWKCLLKSCKEKYPDPNNPRPQKKRTIRSRGPFVNRL